MKNIKKGSFFALLLLLTACATTAKFPTSSITPAADIVATKKVDKNGNYNVSITAKNLASPNRLDPQKSVYIAWVLTESGDARNIGRLINKNAKTATLETLTPFGFTVLFITAEGQADVSYPKGVEISRVTFKK
jgi:hypothetical protein